MSVIRNFRDTSKGLEVCLLKELGLSKSDKAQLCRGFYMNYAEQYIGLVATERGPVFFCDESNYFLQEGSFHFFLQHNQERNTFYFAWNGAVKKEIAYSRILCSEDGRWVDDSVRDFLYWLTIAVRRDNFFTFYTQNEFFSPYICGLNKLESVGV